MVTGNPVQPQKADDVDLRFVRHFDLDELAIRNHDEVRTHAAVRAVVVGRAALIDTSASQASMPPVKSSKALHVQHG
jgi:hypothetical protein